MNRVRRIAAAGGLVAAALEIENDGEYADAHEWYQATVAFDEKARGGRPGTSALDHRGMLEITRQLLVDNRRCLAGDPYERHNRDHYGFKLMADIGSKFAIENRTAPKNTRSNGNFGCWAEGFCLDLNGRGNGLHWRGAQVSGVRDCTINDAREIAVQVGYGSCRYRLDGNDIRNGASSAKSPNAKDARGTGIRANAAHGLTGIDNHMHHCSLGWDLLACKSTTIIGGFFENVTTSLRASRNTSGLEVRGIRIKRGGDTPIDLRGAGPWCEIAGTIDDAPKQTYFIDQKGNKRELCRGKNGTFKIGGRQAERL